jgi:hypothetical protein
MNVFRLNLRALYRLLVFILLLALFIKIFGLLFSGNAPSLIYERSEKQFYILQQTIDREKNELDSATTDTDENLSGLFADDYDFISIRLKSKRLRETNKRLPYQIRSARLDYTRILFQHWADIVQHCRRMGLNTIQIDVPWNVHEPAEKKADFKTGPTNDLETFINLVHLNDLYLIVRIDPYVHCSSHEMGGLPSWLLTQSGLDNGVELLDLNNEEFIQAYARYLKSLLPIIQKNQLSVNGPIIAILTQYNNPSELNRDQKPNTILFYNDQYISFLKEMLAYYNIFETIITTVNLCENEHISYCDANLVRYMSVEEKEAHLRQRADSLKLAESDECIGKLNIYSI